MSQQALADALGVHRPAVSNWERGIHVPTQRRIEEIARIVGTDAASLWEGEIEFFIESRRPGDPPLPRAVLAAGERPKSEHDRRSGLRIPPVAYQLVFDYCESLERAGVPEEQIDEARRLMSGETFNTLRKHMLDERTEEGWVKDVKAAWAFIKDTLRAQGFDL